MADIELGCYRKNILNNFHTKSALLENNNDPIKREEKIKHTDISFVEFEPLYRWGIL